MTQHSRATGTLQGVGCEDLNQNCNNHGRRVTEADQEVLLMDTPRQHGKLTFIIRIYGMYQQLDMLYSPVDYMFL